MKCYVHQDIDAVGVCTSCGKAICQDCAVNAAGKIYCQQCLASGTGPASQVRETRPLHTLAVVSVVLGVLGILTCLCGGPIAATVFGIPAAITGWMARKQLLETEREERGLQLATIGLALGIGEAAVGILLLIFVGATFGLCSLTELLSQSSLGQ